MKAYKCDRCGVLFEEDERICIDMLYYKIDCYGLTAGCHPLNLCDGCRRSFVNWFTECKYKEAKANDKPEDR